NGCPGSTSLQNLEDFLAESAGCKSFEQFRTCAYLASQEKGNIRSGADRVLNSPNGPYRVFDEDPAQGNYRQNTLSPDIPHAPVEVHDLLALRVEVEAVQGKVA